MGCLMFVISFFASFGRWPGLCLTVAILGAAGVCRPLLTNTRDGEACIYELLMNFGQ